MPDFSHLGTPLAETPRGGAVQRTELFLALHAGLGVPWSLLDRNMLKSETFQALEALADEIDSQLLLHSTEDFTDESDGADASSLAASLNSYQQHQLFRSQRLIKLTMVALRKFRAAAATPEQRFALAQRYSFSYAALTNWVIRADLMRLKEVNARAAELLAFVGVLGVHDLARPEVEIRIAADGLQQVFDTEVQRFDEARAENLRQEFDALNLEALVKAARNHARHYSPQVVTTTETVIIVKGAGLQKPDETLNTFVRGFWSAMQLLDPFARMTYRRVLPAEYEASPFTEQSSSYVAEIQTGERRVWLKEAYWEGGVVPLTALKALLREWRMATYAWGRTLYDLFGPEEKSSGPEEKSKLMKLFGRYFVPAFLQLLCVFGFLMFVLWHRIPYFEQIGFASTWGWFSYEVRGWVPIGVTFLAACLLAAVMAMTSARPRPATLSNERNEADVFPLARLPFFLLPLIAFLGSPVRYLVGLVFLLLLQAALLLVRDVLWPYRERWDSDTDTSRYYYAQGGVHHSWERRLTGIFFSPVLYRFIVVLGLPVLTVIAVLLSVFQFVPRTVPFFGRIAYSLSSIATGILGDVSGYANDEMHAVQTRSVVEREIRFFHDLPDVNHIHVFAHSQGTPITYELLFHTLPDSYRSKIISYITIGSVLGYYQLVRPALERSFANRLPYRTVPRFPKEFRWINAWNSNDPITLYSALNDYIYETPSPQLTEDTSLSTPRRLTNIKTRGHWFAVTSHGEYWSNLQEVLLPLAQRITGNPEAWRELSYDECVQRRARVRSWWPDASHRLYVLVLSIAALVATTLVVYQSGSVATRLAIWMLRNADQVLDLALEWGLVSRYYWELLSFHLGELVSAWDPPFGFPPKDYFLLDVSVLIMFSLLLLLTSVNRNWIAALLQKVIFREQEVSSPVTADASSTGPLEAMPEGQSPITFP